MSTSSAAGLDVPLPVTPPPPFDPSIHLLSAPPSAEQQISIDELKQLLLSSSADVNSEWCNDHILKLFLIARCYNVQAALEMIQFALTWRNLRQPAAIEAQENWHQQMEIEATTGKIRRPGALICPFLFLPPSLSLSI
jgi:hypothetical protein